MQAIDPIGLEDLTPAGGSTGNPNAGTEGTSGNQAYGDGGSTRDSVNWSATPTTIQQFESATAVPASAAPASGGAGGASSGAGAQGTSFTGKPQTMAPPSPVVDNGMRAIGILATGLAAGLFVPGDTDFTKPNSGGVPMTDAEIDTMLTLVGSAKTLMCVAPKVHAAPASRTSTPPPPPPERGAAPAARGAGAAPKLLPGLKVSAKQFGKKVGKHAEDFGLDASSPGARQWVRNRIEKIAGAYDEVRQGPWNPRGGGGSDYLFYRQGSDVVVTKPSGDFVTVLPGGVNNGWFSGAGSL